jgi:hypothetical protein
MSLPPLGTPLTPESNTALVTALADMAHEASAPRDEFTPLADIASTVYLYGSYPKPSSDKLVINAVSNVVIAFTSAQTGQPISVKLRAVESGENAPVYWNGPDRIAQQLMLDPIYWLAMDPNTGAPATPQPLPEGMDEQLTDMGVKPEWLVKLDDKTASDAGQVYFD